MTAPPRTRRRTIEAHPAVGTWVRVRVYIAAAVLSGLLGGLMYRAWDIQIAQADHYRELARRQHLRTVEVPAPRGAIRDATGHELAVTADVDSVYASPREVVDVVGTAATVAEILDIDVRVAEARLSSSRYFVWLDRHVKPAAARAIEAAGLPGISLTKEPRRYYPAGALAGPILGFSDIDGNGLEGLERAMDEYLAGKQENVRAVRDAAGSIVMPGAVDSGAAGASLTLTIDRSIQFFAERALAEAVEAHRAQAGTVVVMDVHSGGVLAMASWPTYDPNDSEGRKMARRGARNRALTDVFEVGSVMKVFTVAAALDTGVVRPDQVFDVEKGRYKVGRKVFRDTYHDELLTVGGILKRSSNVGVIKIAQRLGAQPLHDALVRLGFGRETGIELPGEQRGLLWPADGWGDIELATIAFGYGLSVTPMQLAAALAAIGNGGTLYPPRIIHEIVGPTGEPLYRREPAGTRAMKRETAEALWPMLASVFDKGRDGGTARSVDVVGFRAGGKTGTSYKIDPQTGTYDHERYLSAFMGLAPIDEPQIAVVVLIDEPGGEEHYGGVVAGPAFARIVSDTLRYLGVPGQPVPRDQLPGADFDHGVAFEEVVPIDDAAGEDAVALGEAEVVVVPDFAGMSMARALDVAHEAGLAVEVTGSGRAVTQRPAPGAVPGNGRLTVQIGFAEASAD